MTDLKKSRTSLRQQLRNPSGRTVIVLSIAIIGILLAVFLPGAFDQVSENYSNRPQVHVVTPGPDPHKWSVDQALDFFREYAIARPPPEGELRAGVETCWDYANSLVEDGLAPFPRGQSSNSVVAPLAASVPLWGLLAGDQEWRFWENTLSVVGPC